MSAVVLDAFVTVFLAWVATSLYKGFVVRDSVSEGHRNGGMPSSHTATGSSLTVILYLHLGADPAMLVALFLTIVIGTDAVRVRKTIERQARAVNTLLAEQGHEQLEVVEGHTYREVWAGALFGTVVAVVVYLVTGLLL